MTITNSILRRGLNPSRQLLALTICLLSFATAAFAQSSATDGATPAGYTAGAPAGSYPLSGFDSINFFNGNLNFNLPFLQLKGRGGSGHTLALKIERKWRKMKVTNAPYASGSGGWQIIQAGYGAGALEGRIAGMQDMCDGGWGATTLLRLTFTAPDGTEYELRDVLTGGAPGWTEYGSECELQTSPSRGQVFITADGSSATFISDVPISDGNGAGVNPSGYLLLRDGTRFRISMGKVTQMRDRNGNLTTYNFTNGRLSSVVDSLGRSVTISYHSYGTGYDSIVYKGSAGAERTIKVWYSLLQPALRSGYSLQTYRQLFPELSGTSTTTQFNPEVVSSLQLPDNRSYSFQYNAYGELARVVLPTGGALEYDWEGGLSGGTASGVMLNGDANIYRRLVEKRIYDNGGSGSSYTSRTTVSKPEDASSNNVGYVVVEQRNSSGTLLTKELHYYHGSSRLSFLQDELAYGKWKEGKEWKTEVFASNGITVLRRVEHTWQQPSSPTTWPLTQAETSDNARPNDPQITQTVTTLVDTNQVSKQTLAYDKYSNKTDVYEYDYGSGSAGSLVRRSHTDYLTTNSINSIAYDTVNPSTSNPSVISTYHLRILPTQAQVFDAGGTEKSRATFEYDNYVNDTLHAPLDPCSLIFGLCDGTTPACPNNPNFTNTAHTTRGNVTRSTNWILSTSTPLHSYPQYDVAGNVTKMIDPRGYATDFDFNDNFGAPDGEAQTNTAPSPLGGLKSYGFAKMVTNALGHVVYTQFDYYTGRAVDFRDANGIVSSGYSVGDALDRPTKVIRAVNTAAQNQTVFTYDDTAKTITTASDHTSFNDLYPLKSQLVYDSLGRTIETRQYEGGTNYIATQQQYDTLGRAYKTSNPFRPWQSETPVWTQSAFDALGRVTTVTTPDNAVVTTTYSGNAVTVTDQVGKKRRSVTDGLGRLVRVDEPDANNNLDSGGLPVQPTGYSYDVLDNLITVAQGAQTRTFVYDSLKRLKSATNPESGTINYTYDNNNNLLTKTDARGVVSTYTYDGLNRNLTVVYTNDPSGTLPITRRYDSATSGLGRLYQSETTGTNGSLTTIDSYDPLGQPLTQRQQFYVSGAWSQSYTTQRAYNRAGGVTTQTYPSGHTVSYNYDAAGRLGDNGSNLAFAGNLGDGTQRTYARGNLYSPFGGLSREQFGTDILPLYHKLHYTNRGQLYDMRVSTVNDEWNFNRGAIVNYYSIVNPGGTGTDTNGNLYAQQHFIPHDDSISAYTVHQQSYAYDSLNRITWVGEYLNAATNTGSQYFTYDRWGNRLISPATWGTGINNKQFTVSTTNNRLGVPGGQSGVMSYDNAGNPTTDTYTGAGSRTYDAENRMVSAQGGAQSGLQYYTYNADGQRVRRKVDGVETWQVYGTDGELLAEYAANAPASNPQKEYGYRNGQMLITAESAGTNIALSSNGAVATTSSTYNSSYPGSATVNGDRKGLNWNNGGGWNDATATSYPDWLQLDFNGTKSISEIDVFTLQDNPANPAEPTVAMTFGAYGVTAFEVQYWNGASWVTVPGGSVTGNNRVWRKFTFTTISTSKIRVLVNNALASYSRIVELEAWAYSSGSPAVNWLVADHLGTPRMIFDKTGSLANVKRHDYLPFGEELFAGVGGRTTQNGYTADTIRQKFTSKERDNETGLDYFLARYYSSTQGRFTSPDEFSGGPNELFVLGSGDNRKQALPYAEITQPQSLNKYTYAYNNPCRYVDPDGHCGRPSGLKSGQVGICVASYIQSKLVPPGAGPGRGDGRDPNGQGGTSRVEVRVVVDTSKGTVTKTDEAMGTSGVVLKGLGPQGSGGSQVSSPPGKDEKGNLYFQISQHGESNLVPKALGTIDNHLNMVVTPDNKVGITPSSTARDYPSLEVFKYTMDDKGNVTTTKIFTKTEGKTMIGLRRPEKPIQADPQ